MAGLGNVTAICGLGHLIPADYITTSSHTSINVAHGYGTVADAAECHSADVQRLERLGGLAFLDFDQQRLKLLAPGGLGQVAGGQLLSQGDGCLVILNFEDEASRGIKVILGPALFQNMQALTEPLQQCM